MERLGNAWLLHTELGTVTSGLTSDLNSALALLCDLPPPSPLWSSEHPSGSQTKAVSHSSSLSSRTPSLSDP